MAHAPGHLPPGSPERHYQLPLAPVLIAVILGPLAETELRRALTVSEGDLTVLVSSPVTVILYVLLALTLVITSIQHLRHRRAERAKIDEDAELTSA